MGDGSDSTRTVHGKAALALGVSMSLVFSVAWIAAVAVDGTWTFGADMVSDLGVSETHAHYFFGWGSIVAGALGSLCAVCLYMGHEGRVGRAAFVLLFLSGLMLVLVGAFNEDTAPHTPAAVALFVMMWAAMIVLGLRDLRSGDAIEGSGHVTMAAFLFFAFLLNPLPLSEALAVICLLVWVPLVSYYAYSGVPGYS